MIRLLFQALSRELLVYMLLVNYILDCFVDLNCIRNLRYSYLSVTASL